MSSRSSHDRYSATCLWITLRPARSSYFYYGHTYLPIYPNKCIQYFLGGVPSNNLLVMMQDLKIVNVIFYAIYNVSFSQ